MTYMYTDTDFLIICGKFFMWSATIYIVCVTAYICYLVYRQLKPSIKFKHNKRKKKVTLPDDYEIWFDKDLYRQTYIHSEDKNDFKIKKKNR